MVLGFMVFAVVQTVRYGGTQVAAPGVGPGAWVGIAGTLLAAQPILADDPADKDRLRPWLASARKIGWGALVLAALSVGFNLFWRTGHVIPGVSDATFGAQSLAVIVTAAVYGVAALAPVIVGSIWILQSDKASRLATIMLGAAALAAGTMVWITHIGRDIDAYHGIAQNTSTAAVGFEAYLAWAAAAAVFATPALRVVCGRRPTNATVWRQAACKALMLIAVWCIGSASMRMTDLIDAVSLNLEFSPGTSLVLLAADLTTAVAALGLRAKVRRSAPAFVALSWCAGLVALTASRVIIGVVLAPRRAGPSAVTAAENPVYGNMLSQQITSTFDVVLCVLALGILAATMIRTRVGESATLPEPAGERAIQKTKPAAAKRIRHTRSPAQDPSWTLHSSDPVTDPVSKPCCGQRIGLSGSPFPMIPRRR
jgi:hypothetical protein